MVDLSDHEREWNVRHLERKAVESRNRIAELILKLAAEGNKYCAILCELEALTAATTSDKLPTDGENGFR